MCKELEDWLTEEKTNGIEEGKLDTALEMLRDGLSLDKIAQYTKLSVSAIEKLAKQHQLV